MSEAFRNSQFIDFIEGAVYATGLSRITGARRHEPT